MHNHNEAMLNLNLDFSFKTPFETNNFVCFKMDKNVFHCNYGDITPEFTVSIEQDF